MSADVSAESMLVQKNLVNRDLDNRNVLFNGTIQMKRIFAIAPVIGAEIMDNGDIWLIGTLCSFLGVPINQILLYLFPSHHDPYLHHTLYLYKNFLIQNQN